MTEPSPISGWQANLAAPASHGTVDWLWPQDPVDTARYPGIDIVRDRADLHDLGRARYGLLLARDGGRHLHADHEARIFLEPIDRLSLNILARSQGRVVASLRITRANDAMLDPHLEQVIAHADLSPEDLDRSVVQSRLAVERSFAARRLLPDLFRAMLRGARLAEVRLCLTAASPGSVPLLERLGFRPLERRRPYFDETAGWMTVCILDLHDRQRLAETGSPLLDAYDDFAPQEGEVGTYAAPSSKERERTAGIATTLTAQHSSR